MSRRDAELRRDYQLYEMQGVKVAAAQLDAAVAKAAGAAIDLVGATGSLQKAMEQAIRDHVKPVADKLTRFGVHDTEPEWAIVSVLMEDVGARLKIDLEDAGIDGWALRFAIS